MSKTTRVLLADDHPATRIGLRVLLEQASDIEVAGEAEDGQEALGLIEELAPDVAVVDCELPEMEGADVAREIERQGLRVLALSGHDDERYERGSILLTSNRALEEWPDLFGAPLLASAGLDRLTHNARVVIVTGASFRARVSERAGKEETIESTTN